MKRNPVSKYYLIEPKSTASEKKDSRSIPIKRINGEGEWTLKPKHCLNQNISISNEISPKGIAFKSYGMD